MNNQETYCESCSRPKEYCKNYECETPCMVCANKSDECSCSDDYDGQCNYCDDDNCTNGECKEFIF